jgi:hypothetical protein
MLIKSIHQLQQFVRVNISVMEKSFTPYCNDAAEKYLRRFLGETLLLEMADFSDNDNHPDWADNDELKAIFEQAFKLSQNALAKFTVLLGAPAFDLQLTEMGFVVQQNQNTSPASAERVKKLVESLETQGWNNMETLLRFLEKHQSVIESYKNSDAFVMAHGNLINSAEVFDRYVNIDSSRLTFIKLKAAMDDVEIIHIEPVISAELADELRNQQRNSELSDANKKLLLILQRSVANLVAARELKKDGADKYGIHYLAEAKKLIDKFPDDYPLYKESAQYVVNKTSYSLHENSDDSKTFVFGG